VRFTLSVGGSDRWRRKTVMAIEVSEARMELLRGLPLFEGVGDEELGTVGGLLDDIEVEAGEVLTTEGEAGCEAFLIVSGTAEVFVASRSIATLERGALFGEMAVLDGEPRSSTVRAATPMQLLVAGPEELSSMVAMPAIAVRMLRTLAGRLREANAAAAIQSAPGIERP
jgi:cAMP-dependent protein kinase regulator